MEEPPPPPPFSLLTEEEILLFPLEQSSSLVQTDQNEAPSLSHQTEVKKKKKNKKKNKKKKKKTTQGVDSTAENEVVNPADNEVANPAENEETLLFPLEQSSSLVQTDQNEAPSPSHQTEVNKKKKKKKNKKKKKKTTQGVDSTAENEVANPAENEVADPPSRSFPLPTARLPGTLVMKMTSKVDSIQQKAKLYSSTLTDEICELAALFDEARIILQQNMDDTARIIKFKQATISRANTPNHIRNRLCAEVESLEKKINYLVLDVTSYKELKERILASSFMEQLKRNDSELFEMEGAGVSEPDYGQSSFADALAEAKMDTILVEKLANMKFGK